MYFVIYYGIIKHHNPLWRYSVNYSSRIESVAISGNGEYIAVGSLSPDARFYLFHRSSPQPLIKYSTGGSGVHSVAISMDGQYIAVSSALGISLFNNTCPTPEWTNSTSGGRVSITDDGQYIAGANVGFNRTSPAQLWSGGQVISGNGQYVAKFGVRAYIYQLTIPIPTLLWNMSTPYPQPTAYAISADGQHIAQTGNFNLFMGNSTHSCNYTFMECFFEAIAMSADGRYVVAPQYDCSLVVFNFGNPVPFMNYNLHGRIEPIRVISMSGDGQYFVVGTQYRVLAYKLTSASTYWSFETGVNVRAVDISDDGQEVIAGTDEGDIFLFHITAQGFLELYEYIIIIGLGGVAAICVYDLWQTRTSSFKNSLK